MALGEPVSLAARFSRRSQAAGHAWPSPRPANWLEHVNAAQTEAELAAPAALQLSTGQAGPYGADSWCDRTIRSLGLESTIRPRGRPKKQNNGS